MVDFSLYLPEYFAKILERAETLTAEELDSVELEDIAEEEDVIDVLPASLKRFWAALVLDDVDRNITYGNALVKFAKKSGKLERAHLQNLHWEKKNEGMREIFWKTVRERFDSSNQMPNIGIRAEYTLVAPKDALSTIFQNLVGDR